MGQMARIACATRQALLRLSRGENGISQRLFVTLALIDAAASGCDILRAQCLKNKERSSNDRTKTETKR